MKMKRMVMVFLVLVGASGLTACASKRVVEFPKPHKQYVQEARKTFAAQVVTVYSGDTFTVLVDGKELPVRLYGIDAPEYDENASASLNQPFGKEARDYVIAKTKGKTVQVEAYGPDAAGQIVAIVSVDEESLNAVLLRDGYAWIWREVCDEPFCGEDWRSENGWRKLQGGPTGAMVRRVGLWSKIGGDEVPVEPQYWRRKNSTWLRRNLGAAAGVAEVVIWMTTPF